MAVDIGWLPSVNPFSKALDRWSVDHDTFR